MDAEVKKVIANYLDSVLLKEARDKLLRTDIQAWNEARKQDPKWVPELAGVDLSGVHLKKVDLSGANLCGAILNKADLSGAILRGANLSGAHLYGAELSGADLSGASLENIEFTDEKGESTTDLTNAILENTRFTREEQADSMQGFLELACLKTLSKANFKNPADLIDYISRAFLYAHREDIPEKWEFPNLVSTAIKRIQALQHLYQATEPSELVIEEIKLISANVLAYLKQNPKKIHEIGSRQFEELIAEILAGYGWQVQLTPSTKDGGYDLFAVTKNIAGVETSWLIECKRYREDRPVGIDIARALYGVKSDLKVANAMLATTSRFTKGVKAFKASRYDLQLKDYEGILEWINQYQPHPDGQWYVDSNSGLVLPHLR